MGNIKTTWNLVKRIAENCSALQTALGLLLQRLEWTIVNCYEIKSSVDFLDRLGVPFIKVGSGDANNFPLLLNAAKKGKPLIVSSGMQTLQTMRKVYQLLYPLNKNFCFLQCTSAYPTMPTDVNLRAIQDFQKEFPDIPIGYSGHEVGSSISIAAVALGAKVIERHMTLCKSWKGTDHAASLEPDEFKSLINSIRTVELALGNPEKRFLPCELPCWEKLGKSIVASQKILEGQRISEDMICVKVSQPKGLDPERLDELIGKIAGRHLQKDEPITLYDTRA